MGLVISEQNEASVNRDQTPATDDEKAAIGSRIKRLNDGALLLGVGGLGLQGFGRASANGWLVMGGTAALVGGLALYARMRGRNGWWGALGLLSVVGLAVLYLLPKRCHHCAANAKGKVCAVCGAPAPL
jgi:hypothetical protein